MLCALLRTSILSASTLSIEAADGAALDAMESTDEDAVDEDDPSAAPAGARPFSERSQGRLELAYSGNAYAKEVAWQSAFAVSGAWQSRLGVYVGAGYEFVGPFQTSLRSESAGIALTPRVSRYPIHAIVGYHWARKAFGVDGELRVISELDRVQATTFGLGALPPGTKGIATVDDLSFALGFSPRVRFYYRPIRQFSLHLALGADLFAINKSYFVELLDPDTGEKLGKETYLTPRTVRPVVSAGFTLWF